MKPQLVPLFSMLNCEGGMPWLASAVASPYIRMCVSNPSSLSIIYLFMFAYLLYIQPLHFLNVPMGLIHPEPHNYKICVHVVLPRTWAMIGLSIWCLCVHLLPTWKSPNLAHKFRHLSEQSKYRKWGNTSFEPLNMAHKYWSYPHSWPYAFCKLNKHKLAKIVSNHILLLPCYIIIQLADADMRREGYILCFSEL